MQVPRVTLGAALGSAGYALMALSLRTAWWWLGVAVAATCVAMAIAHSVRASNAQFSLRPLLEHLVLWTALWGACGYLVWVASGEWGFASLLPYLTTLLGFGSGTMFVILQLASAGRFSRDPRIGALFGGVSGAWIAAITTAAMFLGSGYGRSALETGVALIPVALAGGLLTGAVSALGTMRLGRHDS